MLSISISIISLKYYNLYNSYGHIVSWLRMGCWLNNMSWGGQAYTYLIWKRLWSTLFLTRPNPIKDSVLSEQLC